MIVLKSITLNGICLTSCKGLVTWLTYIIISCFNKMSLRVNVLFPSIANGILNNLGPIHYPNVDGIEPVLLREMTCDFLYIALFPEPALILSLNLHLHHWGGSVFILMRFSSLAALEVVKMTTSGAASDWNFVEVMTFSFQWWTLGSKH